MTDRPSLEQFPEKVAVLRLPAGSDVPAWAESSSLFSVSATATETTVVCAGRGVPAKVPGLRGLTAFVATVSDDGSSDRAGVAGVLLALLEPLAEESVPVQVLTTVETVWVLVPAIEAERAAEAWRRRGHAVAPAVPSAQRRP